MNRTSSINIFLQSLAKATEIQLQLEQSSFGLCAPLQFEDLIKFFKGWITYIPAAASIFMKFVLQVIHGQIRTEQEQSTDQRSTVAASP
jgi:hypothetical protein